VTLKTYIERRRLSKGEVGKGEVGGKSPRREKFKTSKENELGKK